MAIATIKYDEFNRPKRAKYLLVILGNFDQHAWSKEDTAVPVLSQLELCLLTSLAVFHKRVLKIVMSNRHSCSHPYLPMKNTISVHHRDVPDQNLVSTGAYYAPFMA
jgi:hypothetical protein